MSTISTGIDKSNVLAKGNVELSIAEKVDLED